MKDNSAIEKLQHKYNKLTSAEKNVANFILKNPKECVSYTIKELASASNVSEATVVRMCQHVGFKGYWSFHITLASEQGKNDRAHSKMKMENSKMLIVEYSKMLENLANNIKTESMDRCVELLINCGYAYVIGAGNTASLASHMAFRLGRVGVRSSHDGAPEYFMNSINLARPNDVLIAISQSGVTKDILKGVELAKKRGVTVIAITAYINSKLADFADIVLESKGDFSRFDYYKNYSRLCEMAIIDALCELIQHKNDDSDSPEKDDNLLEILLSDSKL